MLQLHGISLFHSPRLLDERNGSDTLFPKFWLADSAGEESHVIIDNKYIHYSGWGLELKRRLGQWNAA